ncbi:MAG: hypothetical protein COA78_00870 [Blastopirellula sp.]|nr:MAG: hypothetical protein COA78_00870 [Blastopirellula sp.]
MATVEQINALTGLYVAYFDRAPDPEGLQFWIDQLDNGRDFSTISQDFAESQEALDIYPYLNTPEVSSPSAFITQIYINLFGRSPDPDGFAFWLDVLESGEVEPGDMVEAVMLGAQDTIVDGTMILDKTTVDNKIATGYAFVDTASNTPGFEWSQQAYDGAVAAINGVDATDASVEAALNTQHTYFADFATNSIFTLCEHTVLVSEEVVTTQLVTNTVLYWGYNPHSHDETDGVDNTAGGNDNNLTNEGPQDGGIPASAFMDYLADIANIDLTEIDPINVDDDEKLYDFDNLEEITLNVNDDGTGTLTVTWPDGTADDIAVAAEYFALIHDLIFDAEGNSRFFEKEVAADVPVYVDNNGNVTLDASAPGATEIGRVDAVLTTVEGAVYASIPPILTPTVNNGGTFESGFTGIDDDFIQVGRLDLLHGAIIDGGQGYNTLEIDAKGHFAQPKALLNIQHINIENLPNIYTDDDNANQYPDVIENKGGDNDSIIDLSRAVDIETLTITEGDFAGLDADNYEAGDLTVTGIRNGAVVTLDGNFDDGDIRLNYSEVQGDGVHAVFSNLNMDSSLEIAHNSPKLTIESTGGGNYVNDGDLGGNDANLKELYITGDAYLHIEGDMDDTFDDDLPVLIDASANTAGVNLELSGSEKVTFLGTDSDDRFVVSTDEASGGVGSQDEAVTIVGGEGDDHYEIETYTATVSTGTGNNNVELDGVVTATITSAGNGNNHIEGEVVQITATVGDGDNRFDIEAFDSPSSTVWTFIDDMDTVVDLTAGDGANLFNVYANGDSFGSGDHYLKPAVINITAGDGGNKVFIPALPNAFTGVLSTVTINTGDGEDHMLVGGSDITINSGGGNDNITLLGIDNDYVTQVAHISGGQLDDYNYKGFIPSIYGAKIVIDTGTGESTITLGNYNGDVFNFSGQNGAIVAKEGSSITGENITLFIDTDADLRAATLDGITKIILDDDNRDYAGQGFPDGSSNTGDAASLTLLDTQFAALGADIFSTQGETFGAQSILTLIITGDVTLSDLIDFSTWNDSVKLCFVVEDGASLTLTAEELHKYVAPEGIAVDEANGYNDNGVTVTDAGYDFDPYNDQYGGTGGGTVAGTSTMVDVDVIYSPDGWTRPAEDPGTNTIYIDSDVTPVADDIESPFATDLIITGDADFYIDGEVDLGTNFTVDFSGLNGDTPENADGVEVAMTISNFQDITGDVNTALNDPNDGDEENANTPNPATWGVITGNGTSDDPVRINIEIANGDSVGDSDLGVTAGGFHSSGVQQYIVTDILDTFGNTQSQASGGSVTVVVCDQTEDLEVLGLQNNRNGDVTFEQVNWGTTILLEGDGYANSSDQEKNLGNPDLSEVGEVIVNFFEPGANAEVRITNQGVELGLNEDAEDGYDANGERWLDVVGITVNNADRLLINVEDGDAIIHDVTGDDVERVIVNGPEDVTLVVAGVDGNDGSGFDASDLKSLDASGVDGTFTLCLTDNADLSGVVLTGIDAIVLKGDVMLTLTGDQAEEFQGLISNDGSGTTVLNIVDMGDQVIDMAAIDVDDIGTVTFVDEPVTVDAATNFGGADVLIIPEDSQVTMTVAQFNTADADSGSAPVVMDGDGGGNADDNTLILTDANPGVDAVVDVDLTNVDVDVDVDIVLNDFTANADFDISSTGGETTTILVGGTTDLSAGDLGTTDCIELQDGATLTLSQAQIQALISGSVPIEDVIKLADGASATLNINGIDGVGDALLLSDLVAEYPGLDIGTLTLTDFTVATNVTLPGWTLGGADEIVTPTADLNDTIDGLEPTSLTLTQAQFLSLDGIGFISGDSIVNITGLTNNNDADGDIDIDYDDDLIIDFSGISANAGTLTLLEDGLFVTQNGEIVTFNSVSVIKNADGDAFSIDLTDGQTIGFSTAEQASGTDVNETLTGTATNPTAILWTFTDFPTTPIDTSNYDPAINTLYISEDLVDGQNEEDLWTTLPSTIDVQKYNAEGIPDILIPFARVNIFEALTAIEGVTYDDQDEFETIGSLTLQLEGTTNIGDVTIAETNGEGAFEFLRIHSYDDRSTIPDNLDNGFTTQPNKIGDITLLAPLDNDDPLFVSINTDRFFDDNAFDGGAEADADDDGGLLADGTDGNGSGAPFREGVDLEIGTIFLGDPGEFNSATIFIDSQSGPVDGGDVTIDAIDMSNANLQLVTVNMAASFGTPGGVASTVDIEIGGINWQDVAIEMGVDIDPADLPVAFGNPGSSNGGDLEIVHYIEDLVVADGNPDNIDLAPGGSGQEIILNVVGGDNNLKELGDGGDFGVDGVYVSGTGSLTLSADQLVAIGILDADGDGVADNWVLGSGASLTLNICDLSDQELDLDMIAAAGINIGTITIAEPGADLDNGTTLGNADQIILEIVDGDVTLELSAEQFNGLDGPGTIIENRGPDAEDEDVGTVLIDNVVDIEVESTGEATIDVSLVDTTGDNQFFVEEAYNPSAANDPTPDTDVSHIGTALDQDTTFSDASDLGDFAVTLIDLNSTDGVANELAGQTVRFSNEVQAGRDVNVLGADSLATFNSDSATNADHTVGADDKDETDTNVVWLFDTVTGGVDVGGYSGHLGRVVFSDELVDSVSGDVDGLFTIPDPDNAGSPLFTLNTDIIKVIDTRDLDALLQLNVNVAQRVEIRAFTTIAGAEFEIDDPLVSISTLRIDMGGATDINDLVLDNILGPVNPDNPNFPGDDDFELLTINSLIANHDGHYLLPDSWTDAIPLPSNDLQILNQSNTVGDISSGDDRGVLHTILINTFDRDNSDSGVGDTDETLADFLEDDRPGFGGTDGDNNGDTNGTPDADEGLPSVEGTSFIAETIYFSDDGDTTGVGGDTGTPTATLTLTGENDVTVKSLDTSDTDITGLLVVTTGYTGTFTITGGSPAFDGDGTGSGQGDTTETLTFDNDNTEAGVIQLASTITFDDPLTVDDGGTPQVENNEANIEYNVGSGETLPYAGVSGGALESIDTTLHDGTISLGVISQVNSETFSIDAGDGGQLFGCLGTALDDGVEETPSLSATGTWTFTGEGGGDPAFGGANNFDLEIKAIDIADGGTMVFNDVDVCITADLDLTGAVLDFNGSSTLKVAEGAKLILTVEQVTALDNDGIMIEGAGTVCVIGESDDTDILIDTDFSNLRTATVDLSVVTLAASDSDDAVNITVRGAREVGGADLVDENGDRVAQTIIGTAFNDNARVTSGADDGVTDNIDVILRLGADSGNIGDPVNNLTDGSPEEDALQETGDVIRLNPGQPDVGVQIEVDAGFDEVTSGEGIDSNDVVQVAAGAEFYTTTSNDDDESFVATADTTNDGVAVLVLDDNTGGATTATLDVSAAGGANGWWLVGDDDNDGAGAGFANDVIIGSDNDDMIIDGAADTIDAFVDGNDSEEDIFTGNAGADTFVFNVGTSTVATVTDAVEAEARDYTSVLVAYTDAVDDATDELAVDIRIGNSLSTTLLVNETTAPGVDFTSAFSIAAAIATVLNGHPDITATDDGAGLVTAYSALSFTFNGIDENTVGMDPVVGADFTFDDLVDANTDHSDDAADVDDDDQGQVSSTLSGIVDPGEIYEATVVRGDGTALTVAYTALGGDDVDDVMDALAGLLNAGALGTFLAASFDTPSTVLPVPVTGELVIQDADGGFGVGAGADDGGITLTVSGVSTVTGLSSSSLLDGTETTLDEADADVITDFDEDDDLIDFASLAAGSGANYDEGSEVADFATALADADAAMGGGVIYYLTSTAADEGLLFYDANGDGGVDGVVSLLGIDSTSFDDSNIA